jgi:hypothetical protein
MAPPPPPAALQRLRPALERGLALARPWLARMVHPRTHRIFIEYHPEEDRHVAQDCPVRELGTAATLAALQRARGGREFDPAIRATLAHYERALHRERTFEEEAGAATAEGLGATETEAERSDAPLPRAWLRSGSLGEPSSVAHSAMMALALVAWEHYPDEGRQEALLGELGAGLLHQQRADGSLKARLCCVLRAACCVRMVHRICTRAEGIYCTSSAEWRDRRSARCC